MMNSSTSIFVPNSGDGTGCPSTPPKLANVWSSANNPILEAAMVTTPTPSMVSLSSRSSSSNSSRYSTGSLNSEKGGSNKSCNFGNSNVATMLSTLRWLTGIQEATRCLQYRGGESCTRYERIHYNSVDAIEHAIRYLKMLGDLIEEKKPDWDEGPTFDPPRFVPYKTATPIKNECYSKKKQSRKSVKSDSVGCHDGSTVYASDTWNPDKFEFHRGADLSKLNYNSFDILADEDSDEERDDISMDYLCTQFSSASGKNRIDQRDDCIRKKEQLSLQTDLEEAGDNPTMNRVPNYFPSGNNAISMRRIMIRVVTAQAELFAYQARSYGRTTYWTLGSRNFHASLWQINQGLELANSEVSRCFANESALKNRQGLMEDADIVEVAVYSLSKEHDAFLQKATKKQHALIYKLTQNDIRRNQIRWMVGEERWCSNTNRSLRAIEREKQEKQAQEIGSALHNLSGLDTRSAVHSALQLKLRIKPLMAAGMPVTSKYDNRENMTRPSLLDPRVCCSLYPDPSFYGWDFTGSCTDKGERVEFFEKQGMLLDWHYTTAQMELSWQSMIGNANVTFYQSKGAIPSPFYMEVLCSDKAWEVVNRK